MTGISLASADYGQGPPVAILHGLFGSGRNWRSIAQQLAARHRVLAFDLRNHGASPWAEGMSYAEMADDLRVSLHERGIERTALLGHSMGGKVAMLAALLYPGEVERLVVVDIAPVPNPPTLLAFVRAMRNVDLRGITRRSDADAQLAATIPDATVRAFLLQNLLLDGGHAHWRLNLEEFEREFFQILDFPELPAEVAYRGPTLFVAGANSTYIQPSDEPAIRRSFPQARIRRIDGAGHWVHAEQPQNFLRVVEPFLSGAA